MRSVTVLYIFFNDTATTEIYTLSLHDALPIYDGRPVARHQRLRGLDHPRDVLVAARALQARSEEHTSELQSRQYLVCRLLLEKKKQLPWLPLASGPRYHPAPCTPTYSCRSPRT